MTSNVSITASQEWWKKTAQALSLSCAANSDQSFLSCAFIEVDDEMLTMMSQSTLSTTYIEAQDDVSWENEGEFLIPVGELSTCISQMPNEDIVLEYDDDSKSCTLHCTDVTFTIPVMEIANEDMTPIATGDFSKNSVTYTCSGQDFFSAYKAGSSMTVPMSKDSIGHDATSGCNVVVGKKGIQCFSFSHSGAEQMIGEVGAKGNKNTLTIPDLVSSAASVFSHGDVTVGIGEDQMLHLDNGYIHCTISNLNIGSRKNIVQNAALLKIVKPAWDKSVVKATMPGKEFFTALNRASSVKATTAKIDVLSTGVTISAVSDTKTTPFTQSITAETTWLGGDTEGVTFNIDIRHIKKLSQMIPSSEVSFTLATDDKGNPYAMMICDLNDYDPENPHNYFILTVFG